MYIARLRFRTAHILVFDSLESRLSLTFDGLPNEAELFAVGSPNLREATTFVLRWTGFPDEDSARSAGESLRFALLLAFAQLNIGSNLGRDKVSTRSAELQRDEAAAAGIDLRPETSGLVIYRDDLKERSLSSTGDAACSHPFSRVLDAIRKYFAQLYPGLQRLDLALELFGLSFFESSPRARFLVLVTAIESMVKTEPRPPEALTHVDNLISMTERTSLPESEKQKLLSGLCNLRSESIASACSRFVREHGAPEDVATWESCHKIRHKLSHAGQAGIDLPELQSKLQLLVQRILLAAAGTTRAEA